MNVKQIIIGSAIFLVGLSIGNSNVKEKTTTVTKEIPVEKLVVKEIPRACDFSTWKSLKEIDDKGFNLAAEGMNLCGEGFDAASKFDVKRLESITSNMLDVAQRIKSTSDDRSLILKSLGY